MSSKKEENNDFGFSAKRDLGFKTSDKSTIMDHVFEEYDDSQIRQMYDMYMDESNYNYNLNLQVGTKIKGVLTGQQSDSFLVDVGYKDFIRIDNRKEEISALRKIANEDGEIEIGTELEVLITEVSEYPYSIKGSISAIEREILHDKILDNLDSIYFDAYIKSSVPAGYIVELINDDYKMPSFMPNILAGVNKVNDPESLVGQTIQVMIESYSADKGTYISSRKKYLKSLIPYKLENLVNIDDQGNPVEFTGKVTGNTTFGVFVEFDECLTGMIHEANLNDEWKEKLKTNSIKPNDTISFYVKEIIQSKNKLMLVQEWRETLWDTIEEGQIYEATVESFKKFGMLARLDSETIGLIRTADLEKSNIRYNQGDKIEVVVTNIQRGDRKIYFNFNN